MHFLPTEILKRKKNETIYFFLQLNLHILTLVLNFKITILATSKGSVTDVLAGQQCGSDILSVSLSYSHCTYKC